MPSKLVIMMALKHFYMSSSRSVDGQLHLVVEKAIVLLPVTFILIKQHSWNALFCGQIALREAQCGANLLCSVIILLNLLKEVSKSIREHILDYFIIFNSGSVQVPEA